MTHHCTNSVRNLVRNVYLSSAETSSREMKQECMCVSVALAGGGGETTRDRPHDRDVGRGGGVRASP